MWLWRRLPVPFSLRMTIYVPPIPSRLESSRTAGWVCPLLFPWHPALGLMPKMDYKPTLKMRTSLAMRPN